MMKTRDAVNSLNHFISDYDDDDVDVNSDWKD